jgi:hypothetical protein
MVFTGVIMILFGAVLVIVAISVAVSLANISQRLKYLNTIVNKVYINQIQEYKDKKGV